MIRRHTLAATRLARAILLTLLTLAAACFASHGHDTGPAPAVVIPDAGLGSAIDAGHEATPDVEEPPGSGTEPPGSGSTTCARGRRLEIRVQGADPSNALCPPGPVADREVTHVEPLGADGVAIVLEDPFRDGVLPCRVELLGLGSEVVGRLQSGVPITGSLSESRVELIGQVQIADGADCRNGGACAPFLYLHAENGFPGRTFGPDGAFVVEPVDTTCSDETGCGLDVFRTRLSWDDLLLSDSGWLEASVGEVAETRTTPTGGMRTIFRNLDTSGERCADAGPDTSFVALNPAEFPRVNPNDTNGPGDANEP